MCNKKNFNLLSEILFSSAYILFRLIQRCKVRNFSHRENTIVISLYNNGDTVFTIPAIKKFNRLYEGKLIISCYEHRHVIYQLVFHDIRFWVVPKPLGDFKSGIPSIELRKQIKSLRAKPIFDITGTVFTSPLISGQNTEQMVGNPKKIFHGAGSHVPKRCSKPHLTDMYLDMVPIIGHDVTKDNDMGPLYITSVLGKPIFSIYGPTNPVYSMPFNRCYRFIKKHCHVYQLEMHNTATQMGEVPVDLLLST